MVYHAIVITKSPKTGVYYTVVIIRSPKMGVVGPKEGLIEGV